MSLVERFRLATVIQIDNIAVPTGLIVLILLVVGLLFGGVILALVYLFRRLSNRSEERTQQ